MIPPLESSVTVVPASSAVPSAVICMLNACYALSSVVTISNVPFVPTVIVAVSLVEPVMVMTLPSIATSSTVRAVNVPNDVILVCAAVVRVTSAMYVFTRLMSDFLFVPPPPSSIMISSASARAAPISVPPSIFNALSETLFAVDIVSSLVSAIAALDFISALTMFVIVLLSESMLLFVTVCYVVQ